MSSRPIQDLRDDMAGLVRAVAKLGEELRRMESELGGRLDNLAVNARAQSVAFDSLLDISGANARKEVEKGLGVIRLGLKAEIDERMARCGVCAEQIGHGGDAVMEG